MPKRDMAWVRSDGSDPQDQGLTLDVRRIHDWRASYGRTGGVIHDGHPNQARGAKPRWRHEQCRLHKIVGMAAHFIVHRIFLSRTSYVAAHIV